MPTNVSSKVVKTGDYYSSGSPSPINEVIQTFNDQLIWGAEGHYGWPDPNGKDVGGAFLVTYERMDRAGPAVDIKGSGPYSGDRFKGVMLGHVEYPWGDHMGYDPNLIAWGATAYSRLKPAKPAMSGLNAIYELKDLPGMLQQRFLKNDLSSIGSYHLALEFGWKPLLRDVRAFVETQRNSQNILGQLMRDEGRPVRRRVTLLNEYYEMIENQTYYTSAMGPPLPTYLYDQWGNHPVVRKRYWKDTIWASGQFVFFLPPGPRDVAWSAAMKRKIFGLTFPSPKQIYDAIPWSWLIDWFGNLGDVIDNLEDTMADRQYANYCYIMRQRERACVQTSTGHFFSYPSGSPITVTATSTRTQGNKMRVQGSPFGFGVGLQSLNPSQIAILGALGLSRHG